ncbi:MAG: hypothetical protein C0510_00625 [Erythrobacter sp.]|nr:hypothetical protein [Erythrobacter sp.]
MHRSGTSAITRVLNLLGCALPDELIGAGDGNAVGHWESVAAVTLNDAILDSAGSSWEDWGPINDDWRNSGLKSNMMGRIGQVVQDHAKLGPLFALKDPRLCRLADLWLEAMAAAEVEPRVVVMLRNPAEVCASLEERDLMAPGYGQLLWLRHVLDAERFSRGVPRVLCRYDQLMRNWNAEVERIKAGLGIALPRNAPAVHVEIEQFLSGEHRHHELGADPVPNDVGPSSWLRRTYSILTAWSEQGENSADHADLDRIRHEFDQAYSTFARMLLGAGISGSVGSGSQLKRELSDQLVAARQAAEAASQAVQGAEARQAAAAEKEAELQAHLEADRAQAQQLQAEIDALRADAEQLGRTAAEAEALRARETQLVQDVTRLAAALLSAESAVEQERQIRLAAEQTLATRIAELHDQEVRNAELAGRAAAGESALVQRQEELAQLWNQLLAVEKAAAVAEAGAADLRSQLDEARAAPAPVPELQIAEIAQLTRMLQEQETVAQAATAALSEAEQSLTRQANESSELSARVQELEAATRSAEATRAETEQKLAARFDEIARLTAMLADESSRSTASVANAEWLRSMMQMAARFPKWWALMPQGWRRKREHARYRSAGLFDADEYLETYPDVAKHGMDPVRHYILHGIAEGRLRPQKR